MPLIHMEPENVLVPERPQQAESPDPQHHFLTQAIMVVSPVEHIGEGPVPGLVLTHIGIEQIHRNDMPGLARYTIPPGPDMDRATFDIDRGLPVDQLREIIDRPCDRLLDLLPVRIQPLEKVPSAVQQRHRHHRHFQIRSRANRVAGEHTKPSRIGRHPGLKADLHGKVGNERRNKIRHGDFLPLLPLFRENHDRTSTYLIG